MARKTKAELAAEREEALALQEAHDFAAYPSRLMKVLEEATSANNYELTVENNMFVLRDREYQHRPETVTLSLTHTRESNDTLDTLVWVLESKMLARAEETRRYEVRATALAKLTKEERELLNL
jgi:hypothetical protein